MKILMAMLALAPTGGVFNDSEARQKGVCIVADVTGCCETSPDFLCAEALSYPGDYPGLYSRIVVMLR